MRFSALSLIPLITTAYAQPIEHEAVELQPVKQRQMHYTGAGQVGGSGTRQAFANALELGDAPWSVRITFPGAGGGTFCSGALVHPRYVLTAAHCIDGNFGSMDDWDIAIGGITVDDDDNQHRGAVAAWMHPDFVGDTPPDGFDIAIIELDGLASATPVQVPDFPPPFGLDMRLAAWGTTVGGVDPGIQQWGEYDLAGFGTGGTLNVTSLDGAVPCGGDSGGPYVALANGLWTLVAIHSASNDTSCGGADLFWATRVDAPPIRDFITGIIGNLDCIQWTQHSWRDHGYFTPAVNAAWIGHALRWKALRNQDTHAYLPPFPMPNPPVHCGVAPEDVLDSLEVTQFSPSDPAGSWGCWQVDSVDSLYLAAAYAHFRWNSPAYVRTFADDPMAITRLVFEVYDWTGESVPLAAACGWTLDGPALTAQAAADSCDLLNFDIQLHAVDYYLWTGGQMIRNLRCAEDFELTFAPAFDIVFDPPEGAVMVDMPVSAAERERVALRPAETAFDRRLPALGHDGSKSRLAVGEALAPTGGGAAGFDFSDECTSP